MVANIRFNQTIKSLHEAINVLLETKEIMHLKASVIQTCLCYATCEQIYKGILCSFS